MAWEHMDVEGAPQVYREYAELWRSTDKVVYSATLDLVGSERTRIARTFDADEVADFVAASDQDVSISGPTLAGHALRAGIVDEIGLYLSPVLVGGGLRALPEGLLLDLDLVEERRFANGVVYLGYRPRSA